MKKVGLQVIKSRFVFYDNNESVILSIFQTRGGFSMTECIEDEHGNQLGFVSESWRGKEILFLKDTNGKKIFSILGEKNLNPNKELFEIYQINDSNNKTISKIFFKYEKIPPHKKRFLKKYSWKSSFFL